MPDYQKSKIYKVIALNCDNTDDVYFGSTVQTLAERMSSHRKGYYKWKKGEYNLNTVFNIFDKYGIKNCRIVLVEIVCSNSKEELFAKEAEYIKNNNCVNRNIPNRTKKQWREDNKEYLKRRYIERYDSIKDLKSEKGKIKMNCECGSSVRSCDKQRHYRSNKHQEYCNSSAQAMLYVKKE